MISCVIYFRRVFYVNNMIEKIQKNTWGYCYIVNTFALGIPYVTKATASCQENYDCKQALWRNCGSLSNTKQKYKHFHREGDIFIFIGSFFVLFDIR